MGLVTRRTAKELGLKTFFTGQPCGHGHVTERRLSDGHCFGCDRERARKWRAANPEKMREESKNRKPCNHERKLARERKWRAANRELSREITRRWAAKNPAKLRARTALRDASKLQRTPSWADRDGIAMIYRAAEVAERTFGMRVHVDHIVPLNGEAVSGLHVSNNLQIISAAANCRKRNSHYA